MVTVQLGSFAEFPEKHVKEDFVMPAFLARAGLSARTELVTQKSETQRE